MACWGKGVFGVKEGARALEGTELQKDGKRAVCGLTWRCGWGRCSPYKDFWAFTQYIFLVLFFLDMVFKFRVAYYDDQILVTDTRDIARHYLRQAPPPPHPFCWLQHPHAF